jgi:spore germination protein YaaH
VTASEVTLNWEAVSKATGYKVYRVTPNDSNYVLIATVSTTSYKNTSLTPNSKYWYFVKAYNSYGTSPDSIHINITTAENVTTSQKVILGYTTYYYSGDASSYNSMTANTSMLDEIATNTYTTDGYGNISGQIPTTK